MNFIILLCIYIFKTDDLILLIFLKCSFDDMIGPKPHFMQRPPWETQSSQLKAPITITEAEIWVLKNTQKKYSLMNDGFCEGALTVSEQRTARGEGKQEPRQDQIIGLCGSTNTAPKPD